MTAADVADRPTTSVLRKLLHVGARLYGAFAAVAVVVWWVLGDAWWLQPANLTTFWWSLPAVGLVPVAVLTGHRRTAGWLAVPAAVFVWSYGAMFFPSPAVGSPDLTVATFNTYVHSPDVSHVADLVSAHDPDVLVLQEVFESRAAELESDLGHVYPHRWFGEDGVVGGVAVLSRHPISDVRPVALGQERSRPTAVVTVDVGGRAVQIVPIHLTSPCPTCGDSLVTRAEFEGDARAAEMNAVLGALDPSIPAVVAGDFNSNDRSEPYRMLRAAGFADAHRDAGRGPGFTWPAGDAMGPWIRLDWVLARGLSPVREYVVGSGVSDHRPVVAELRLED